MAAANFPACLAFTLRYEGGYVDHPRDPGGATNLGITQGTLASWRKRPVTKAEVKALSKDEADAIYRARYWNAVRGDDLPAGVDLVVFDFAVNSGVARAVKALQAACGVRQDGVIAAGGDTLAAIDKMHAGELVKRICDNRLAFVQRLKTWSTFGKGWASRIRAVRAAATAMVSGGAIRVAGLGTPVPPTAAAKAPTTDVAPSATSTGKAALTVGGAGAVTAVASAGDLIAAGKSVQSFSDALPWLTVVGGLIVTVGVGWFLWPRIKRLVRGQGKEEVA